MAYELNAEGTNGVTDTTIVVAIAPFNMPAGNNSKPLWLVDASEAAAELPPGRVDGTWSKGSNGGCGVLGQGPNLDSPGPGVIGIGGDALLAGAQAFAGAPGVSGQGGGASAIPGPPGPGSAPAGPGLAGQGGGATTFFGGAQGNVPSGAPGAPGVTGTGGAAAFAANPIHHAGAPPARGAAGPGIVGQGGTGLGDEAAGSGVIGVSGDTPIPEGIGGYGGIFTSASHAQVHIVPAGNATQGANNPPPLPSNGQAGDLFVRVVVNADNLATAELWFCSRPVPGLPANTPPANTLVIWNQVTLGASTQPPGPLG